MSTALKIPFLRCQHGAAVGDHLEIGWLSAQRGPADTGPEEGDQDLVIHGCGPGARASSRGPRRLRAPTW